MKKLKEQEGNLPEYIDTKKKYYIIEIMNEKRTYVLSASNQKDLEGWFISIENKIDSHQTNKFISETLKKINEIE